MPVHEPALRCRGLAVDHGPVHAVRGVDIDMLRARLTVIAGPSGSGKSSLLRALAGLDRIHAGTIEVDGADVTGWGAGRRRRLRRDAIGVVLQEPSHNLLPYLTAREQLVLAARLRGSRGDDVDELLAAVGLSTPATTLAGALSGGEQQRVAFAAAAVGASLILADEPTASLDAVAGDRLVVAMRALLERGSTIVVTSHDAAVIAAADDLVELRDGLVV